MMEKDFTDLMNCAQAQYPEAFSPQEDGGFVLAFEGLAIAFVPIPVEPEMLYVRARVLNISSVGRPGDFAKAAIAGNFFWGGTRGATLSVGEDNALYLTERRAANEFADEEALAQCVRDFELTVGDWRERSELYA